MDMTVEVPELPELTFDEASHIYRLNGDIIPSVSKLMEPLKDQCYGGISKRTLENAAIKGSAVHNSIENWIKFGIDDIPSEHRGYFNGFMEWWKQYKPRVFGSEVRIYHMEATIALVSPGASSSGGGGGSTYVLPVATATRLGGVKIGKGISVAADGTITASTSGVSPDDMASTEDTESMLDEVFPSEDENP